MVASWERLYTHTLASAGQEIDTGVAGIAAKKHLRIVFHIVDSGTANNLTIRFNGDTSANYPIRRSTNDGTDSTYTTTYAYWYNGYGGTNDTDRFGVIDIINVAEKEKLIIHEQIIGGDGQTNFDRIESVGKWVNTSAQITDVHMHANGFTGSDTFGAGTTMTIFGADDQVSTAKDKTSITDVPAGTRYEETDTEKIFRFKPAAALDKTDCIAYYHLENNWTNSALTSAGFTEGIGTDGVMTAQNSAGFSGTAKLGSYSASFPSQSDHAKTSTSNGANFDFTGDSTVAFWLYRTDGVDGNYHAMVSKRTGSNSEYNLYLEPTSGKARLYITMGACDFNNATTATFANATWYHLVTTLDGEVMKFYVNGSLDSTHDLDCTRSTLSSQPFGIGAISANGAEGFVGYLDEVSIWERVLSTDEIGTLYNGGTGATIETATTTDTWKEKGTA